MPKISGEILINQSVELVLGLCTPATPMNRPPPTPANVALGEDRRRSQSESALDSRATAQLGRREIEMLIEVTESVESSVNRQRNRRYPRRVRKPFPYMAVERLHPIRPKAGVMAVMAVGPLQV